VRSEDGDTVPENQEAKTRDHPAGYMTHPDLAEAVNTAVILRKPLLLTGKPGQGKATGRAYRLGVQFGAGATFEAQSLSEANDLFYRFDLVGQMAAVQLSKAALDRNAIDANKAGADSRPERF